MSRATAIMQGLRSRLKYWTPRIKQAALLTHLEFVPTEGGEFTVIARWKLKGVEGEYRTHFTRERVLGRTLTSPRQAPVKDACAFRNDIVREILHQRGI